MDEMSVTVRRSIELLGLCLIGLIIVSANGIIMPILMAFFIAIMLIPVYRFLKRKGLPESISIILSIVLAALVVGGILWFFTMQVASLVSDIPQIQKNLNVHWQNISSWVNTKTHFSAKQQIELLRQQAEGLVGNAGSYLSGAAVSLSGVFIFVGLLPLYVFLILFYKNLLLRFTFLWFSQEHHDTVKSALYEVETMTKAYLLGLVIQITYITILLGGVLLLLGIKHALLIGIIFAILNLIPYIGALIGNLIGVLLTLTSSQELWQIWAVLGVIAVVQFLDNNILMPRIIGGKVKLNALASIVGVFIGGALAGVSGMFLSLPVMAMLKIIFDRTLEFRQWGILLGDHNPHLSPMSNPVYRMRNRKQRLDTNPSNDSNDQGSSSKPGEGEIAT